MHSNIHQHMLFFSKLARTLPSGHSMARSRRELSHEGSACGEGQMEPSQNHNIIVIVACKKLSKIGLQCSQLTGCISIDNDKNL